MAKLTTAIWDGDNLIINWFGIPADDCDPAGAIWRGGNRPALIFEGLSESKAWKMSEKPSAEKALELIIAWQNGY